jgi:hypothetical protein
MMKKLLGVAGVVLVLGIVYLVVRTDEKDKKKDPSTSSSSSSSSGASGGSSSGGGAAGNSASSSSGGSTSSSSSSSGGGPSANPSGSVNVITSGQPVDMEQLLLEAKYVESARSSLASGDPKKALADLDFYFKIPAPNGKSLRQEATLLKIEALAQVGRKTEARSLAYSTRDDPSFDTYQGRIDALLTNQK